MLMGSYVVTARATDNLGAQTTSAPITVTIVNDQPPTITLAAAPATAVAPANVTLTATASDADGTVAKVEFFQGVTLIATVTSAPYTFTVNNLAAGAYSFTARATDNLNAATTSAAVAVTLTANQPPTVSITAPANNTILAAPATIVVTAIASDTDGTVAKVEILNGATVLATLTSAPYTFTIPNAAAGTYVLTARATDDKGGVTTSTAVNVIVDTPPAVTLAANPPSGIAPATVTLTATATDADGIAKVEFLQGAAVIATLTAAPYTFTVNNLAVGSYSFSARATDSLGVTTTSSAVAVAVVANQAPTVSITAPANNATFVAPATINITATAADADGTIAKVELYNNATLVATLTASPYTFSLTNVPVGSYALTAIATDNLGATTASSAVNVTVNANQPPSVTLTSPNNNAVFTAPATITLTATANDTDGTIASVEFLSGSNVIATLTAPPYSFAWTNVGVGGYTLTARATDDKGAQTTSAPRTVTVNAAAATIFYIYTDQLNTPRAITNEAATKVWSWDNVDPFGANAPNEDPDGDGVKYVHNPRFPGQYFDKETNAHYNMARDYSPSEGRYIESDPIGISGLLAKQGLLYDEAQDPMGSLDPDLARLRRNTYASDRWDPHGVAGMRGDVNLYTYVRGNPISLTDPLGLFPDGGSGGAGMFWPTSEPPACGPSWKDTRKACYQTCSAIGNAMGGPRGQAWIASCRFICLMNNQKP